MKWKWQDREMENIGQKCSECGEPISAALLKDRPFATLCIDCKTKREKQPKIASHEKPEKVKKRRKGGNRGGVNLRNIAEIG